MINKHENQFVEIEFWDIEPEDVPELEESDIKRITRTIIIDKIIKVSYFILFIL